MITNRSGGFAAWAANREHLVQRPRGALDTDLTHRFSADMLRIQECIADGDLSIVVDEFAHGEAADCSLYGDTVFDMLLVLSLYSPYVVVLEYARGGDVVRTYFWRGKTAEQYPSETPLLREWTEPLDLVALGLDGDGSR